MKTRAMVGAGAATVVGLAGAAAGQCTPQWDTAMGNPGIADGYAAPVRAWSDGKVYAGGSFSAAGGDPSAGYFAAWNPANNTWSSVGGGVSPGFTNAFVTTILPFTPPTGGGERLVVGGFFDLTGGVPNTASLAMWNGQTWQDLGTQWTGSTRGAIWSMAVWNGTLYVGGQPVNQPAMIGGQPWGGMASWNGAAWTSLSSGMTGISPVINAMSVFNDGSGEALYVAGRFSSINGVAGTSMVARWNGTAWTAVGSGLTSTSQNFGLEGITVFNDGSGPALYVAGYTFNGATGGTTNVAKWNGQTWTRLGAPVGTGRLTSIAAFDDGSGAKLYIGGTAMPQINYVARWENSAWTPVGGGVTGPGLNGFPSVFGLRAESDRLYVAGNFTQVNNLGANGFAAWTGCMSACYANCDGSTATPVLNVNDFICFQAAFAAGASYANCDGSTAPPVLNVNDFICFQGRFASGCP